MMFMNSCTKWAPYFPGALPCFPVATMELCYVALYGTYTGTSTISLRMGMVAPELQMGHIKQPMTRK